MNTSPAPTTPRRPYRGAVVLLALAFVACAAPSRQPAVPQALEDRAVVPGFPPSIRAWGETGRPDFVDELRASIPREKAWRESLGETGPLPASNMLAISGGGANGAFTAGLLKGWTAAGTRPEFKAVTGISTGALIAPFAFLGPDHDATLERFYTGITNDDVLTERTMFAALYDDAMADSAPLRAMIAELVDPEFVGAIAAEHEKGRILLLGTTNLDSHRAVIWNVGAIAASGHPRAVDLIRDVLLASASIPGAFPPVMIDVEVDGAPYQEMHVDGGTSTQVFLYPPSLEVREIAEAAGVRRERRVYVVRNSRLRPEWKSTPRRTLDIAGRAVSSLIATQGIGDLYRTFLTARRDGLDFNLAFIPDDFTLESEEAFDPVYMKALFDRGFAFGSGGTAWRKLPPAYEED